MMEPDTLPTALQKYCVLLIRIDILIREGQGDSPEADQLRDRMDRPFHQLSPKDLDFVAQLDDILYLYGQTDVSTDEKLGPRQRG